jgi:hypothetical protein
VADLVHIGGTDFAWETSDFPLCQLSISAADLARIHHLPLDQWEEDGLGAAQGFCCSLAGNLTVHVQELLHSPVDGAVVYVDAAEFALKGPDGLMGPVLQGFDIPTDCVKWIQSADNVATAAHIRDLALARRGRA